VSLRLSAITVSEAKKWIGRWHRHLPKIQGGLYAVGVSDAELVGVALAANPPRVWQGTGRVVIARCAVREGTPNACSKLYAHLARASFHLGYTEVWTYTLPEEPGTSLVAAGFHQIGWTKGGEWDCDARPREAQPRPESKRRWVRVSKDAGLLRMVLAARGHGPEIFEEGPADDPHPDITYFA